MYTPESTQVVRSAKEIISAQESVPLSPAVYSGGGIDLCLAAAIAKAGFLCNGWEGDADQLANDLASTRSKALLRAAFRRLGWSEVDCLARLEVNDSAPDVSRKAVVLQY